MVEYKLIVCNKEGDSRLDKGVGIINVSEGTLPRIGDSFWIDVNQLADDMEIDNINITEDRYTVFQVDRELIPRGNNLRNLQGTIDHYEVYVKVE
jgi:hypothetical protein